MRSTNNLRPIIEDRLGRHNDTDTEDLPTSARSSRRSNEMLESLTTQMESIQEQGVAGDDSMPALNELLAKRAELEVTPLA